MRGPYVISLLCLAVSWSVSAQTGLGCPKTLPGKALKFLKMDKAAVKRLMNPAVGDSITQDGVKAYFEKGVFSQDDLTYLRQRISTAVKEVPEILGMELDESRYANQPVTIFFSLKKGARVLSGYFHRCLEKPKPYIFLSAQRLKQRRDPLFHEYSHLVAWDSWSNWLREGIADYVQFSITGKCSGTPLYKPFQSFLDPATHEYAKDPNHRYFAQVGLTDLPIQDNFEERKKFYAVGLGFTHMLVGKLGLKPGELYKLYDLNTSPKGTVEYMDRLGLSVFELQRVYRGMLANNVPKPCP